MVLSTCSEYFSDIFDRTPCKNPVVVLKDINCQDLEFLLDYMYIGEVNVRQNELSSLIKAAECLRIKGLAVPDEEPKKNGSGGSSNNTSATGQGRQRPELASPPAKRRRAEERRVTEQSPGRPPGDGSPEQEAGGSAGKISGSDASRSRDQLEDKQSDVSVEQPAVHIKVEQHDSYEQSANDEFLVQSNSYEGGGGGGEEGDGPHSSEGNTNDFPEFLQSTVEKEEPVAMSDFNPSDFPGPSGLQNVSMHILLTCITMIIYMMLKWDIGSYKKVIEMWKIHFMKRKITEKKILGEKIELKGNAEERCYEGEWKIYEILLIKLEERPVHGGGMY